ncbi:MAG: hypothetical protein JW748_15105 [Anaerolineales bacterium]|nr:hypothetical protein [Anaerolineales bacterium]
MTHYSVQDLDGEWEFKIVRANTGMFRNPAALDKLVQEEAQAGWILLEKFDNTRVRFKRPVSARRNDSRLAQGVDPYRTQYGMSPMWFAFLLTGVILGASLIFTLFLFMLIAVITGAGMTGSGM